MEKRGVTAILLLVFTLLFTLSVYAYNDYSVISDYYDDQYDRQAEYPYASSYDYNSYVPSLATGASTLGPTSVRGSNDVGPTQARDKPSGECTATRIRAIRGKVDAQKRKLDLLQADIQVQIKKFHAQVARMQVLQLKLLSMSAMCANCTNVTLDRGNLEEEIKDLELTDEEIAQLKRQDYRCENCTLSSMMRTITAIKIEMIDIKATIVKIKVNIKKISAEITDIKIQLKGLAADLVNCRWDCPPCPPGTVEVPPSGQEGIFCSAGVIKAFAAAINVQIGHIEAFLAKIEVDFAKIDITVDTIQILIDEINKLDVYCKNCLVNAPVVGTTELAGPKKSQIDIAKELDLISPKEYEITGVKKVTKDGQTLYRTSLQGADGTLLVVDSAEEFGSSGVVRLTVTGGHQETVDLHVVKNPRFGFMRFLGFGLDKTVKARIVTANQNGKVIIDEVRQENLKKGVAVKGCDNCTRRAFNSLFVKVKTTHKKLTVTMLKVRAKWVKAHVDFLKVSGRFHELNAKFLKCSFNCPKCMKYYIPDEKPKYRVGDDYGTQPRDAISTGPTPQQEYTTGPQTETAPKSCEDVCGAKGMVTSMPDWSGHILSELNAKGVCKKTAQVSFGNYLKSGSCTCYPNSPPSVSVSGTIRCENTPCGPVACNGEAQCSCGENCVQTVTCRWGGWRQVGQNAYQPVIQAAS